MALFQTTLGKLKKGLAKTNDVLSTDVRVLMRKQVLTPELLDDLEAKLIQSDMGVRPATELMGGLRQAYKMNEVKTGDQVLEYLKVRMVEQFPSADRRLSFAEEGPTVIMIAGINGAGKTTSIAKLAKSLRDEGRSVMLAACDTFRAAAVDQLGVWADRLGVEVVRGKHGGDPAAVAFDACEAAKARAIDVVLVDTAGRLHTQEHLMRQLTKIRDITSRKIPNAPHEVLLVLDATTGQNAIRQAKIFEQAIDVTGIFLAKLDGTAKGGIVVAIRKELGLPVKFIGVGETPEDVEPFEPGPFVEAMFAEQAA